METASPLTSSDASLQRFMVFPTPPNECLPLRADQRSEQAALTQRRDLGDVFHEGSGGNSSPPLTEGDSLQFQMH